MEKFIVAALSSHTVALRFISRLPSHIGLGLPSGSPIISFATHVSRPSYRYPVFFFCALQACICMLPRWKRIQSLKKEELADMCAINMRILVSSVVLLRTYLPAHTNQHTHIHPLKHTTYLD